MEYWNILGLLNYVRHFTTIRRICLRKQFPLFSGRWAEPNSQSLKGGAAAMQSNLSAGTRRVPCGTKILLWAFDAKLFNFSSQRLKPGAGSSLLGQVCGCCTSRSPPGHLHSDSDSTEQPPGTAPASETAQDLR